MPPDDVLADNHMLTVLRSLGPRMAKVWARDGTIQGYDNAKRFRVRRLPVASTEDLHAVLAALAKDRQACVIRGAPSPDLDLAQPTERRIGAFLDVPSPILMIDIDGYVPVGLDPVFEPEAAIEKYIEGELPACFYGAGSVWQLSGSMGHPSKPGVLRAHLWFLLAEPMTCADLEAWARRYLPNCDHTVHRVVQVNYTADPVVCPDVGDPLAGRRLGHRPGMLWDRLRLPLDSMPLPDSVREMRPDRRKMADPRLKPGVIGAVCRAFKPADIVDLFPDMFAQGSTPARITWLAGGGSPDGICVTDDGLHLYNSHHTSPVQHAAHLFDFVAKHVFGHLDTGLAEDAVALAPMTSPSARAARAWALACPEVQEEMATEDPGDSANTGRGKVVHVASNDDKHEGGGHQQSPTLVASVAQIGCRSQATADARTPLAPDDDPPHNAREVTLDNLRGSISRASVDEIERQLAPRAAKLDLSDAERESLVHWTRMRAKELGTSLPVAVMRRWFSRPRVMGVLPDLGPDGVPMLTQANVRAVLAQRRWTARYNVIAKRVEFDGPGLPRVNTDDEATNRSLGNIADECKRAGMSQQHSTLLTLAVLVAMNSPYNPAAEWIESASWDGEDRLQALADTLTCKPDWEREHPGLKQTILRKWLLQAVALALSPVPLQGRGVLVLVGEQFIGKSRWLQRLAPAGMVCTGRDLQPHNKDSVKLALSHWITELGELGSTFRKSDHDALKAFLANDVDKLRLPYAREESTWQRRTSFAASVNDETFLVDPTGNTRFWPLPVIAVAADHDVDMQQVFAQCAAAWRAGEEHYFDAEATAVVSAASKTHQIEDPWMAQIATRFAWPAGRMQPTPDECVGGRPQRDMDQSQRVTAAAGEASEPVIYWVQRTATEIVCALGVKSPTRADATNCGMAMARLGALKGSRMAHGQLWWIPFRAETLPDDFDAAPM